MYIFRKNLITSHFPKEPAAKAEQRSGERKRENEVVHGSPDLYRPLHSLTNFPGDRLNYITSIISLPPIFA